MFEFIGRWAIAIISSLGYPGVFILMAMESMVLPVPSELVMPFAGFLVSQGEFSFWLVAVVSAFGCLLGSLLSYAIGYYGATPLVKHYGKYFLVHKKHLDSMEHYFQKHGGITVFVTRFVPVVRHISSIPAGAGRMNLWSFSALTLVGAFIWNTFLLWIGFVLGRNWGIIGRYTAITDAVVLIILAGGVLYLYKTLKH